MMTIYRTAMKSLRNRTQKNANRQTDRQTHRQTDRRKWVTWIFVM
ncbi:unnamed protein product [Callosobruchus maculatus]|uniref:Uncharacterized protein n=1 Tax=Callosobruchus maculatus TaxID=64391 RepID=A0A653C3X7_CALMS|nr:unnamed protein product [Callosobruchus maculatus]